MPGTVTTDEARARGWTVRGVDFGVPSQWGQYRRQILLAGGLLLLQSLLIVALLMQARRLRRAKLSLRESEERMNLAAVSANLGLWRSDIATDRIWATGYCRRLLGLDPAADLTRDDIIGAVHPDERQRARRCFEETVRLGKASESEYRIVDRRGRVRWVLSRAQGFTDGSGMPLHLTGVIIDITERKLAEAALRESEERYRDVVETQTELICRYLPDTTLTFVNDTYCRYFQRAREELIGTRYIELVPEAARAETLLYIAALLADRRDGAHEHPVLRPDGSTGWQQWHDHVILDRDGQVAEIQGIGRDVTELKQAEMEAQERRAEVTHLTRVAMLGELSGALAHELNQPLTAILSNAQAAQLLLARQPLDLAEIRDILRDIVNADKRAGDVINRLRSLLKKEEARFQTLDLNEVAAEALDLLHSELIERKVAVTTRLAPDLPRAHGDRIQLQQVLLNLLMNSCEAMGTVSPGERRLLVSTAPEGSASIRMSITDSGTGIPEGLDERLFEPFYSTKVTGLGLGLSICRSIVAAHGGQLRVDSNVERGAIFTFTLPAQQGERL